MFTSAGWTFREEFAGCSFQCGDASKRKKHCLKLSRILELDAQNLEETCSLNKDSVCIHTLFPQKDGDFAPNLETKNCQGQIEELARRIPCVFWAELGEVVSFVQQFSFQKSCEKTHVEVPDVDQPSFCCFQNDL